jgi:hypothetical protein
MKAKLFLLFALTTACSKADDGWELRETASGMDGNVLAAEKLFSLEKNPTSIQAQITCKPNTKELTFTLSSFDAELKNDRYEPQAFVQVADSAPKGRAAFTLANETEQVELRELFRVSEYNNELVFDPSVLSAISWMAVDEEAFWKWGASVSPIPDGLSEEAFIEALKLVAAGGLEGVFASALMGRDGDQMKVNTAEKVAPEFVAYAKAKKALAALAPGAFAKRMLPISIEAYNTGGQFGLDPISWTPDSP